MKTAALLLCGLLCACPEKKEEHAATPVAAPAPVVDAGPAVAVAPAPPPEPEPPAPIEVQFAGTIDAAKLKPARIIFLVTKGPCAADAEELEVLEQMDVSAGELFTEMNFPPGTAGNLCAMALDKKGMVVGFAAYAKNPATFEGQPQVELKDVVLKLQSVKARAAPKGM